MKRYDKEHLQQSYCLNCSNWLAVMAKGATVDAEIKCPKCGRINIYKDSNQLVELKAV